MFFVKLDKVTSLLSNPRQITFRLYSFCHELRLFLFRSELTIYWVKPKYFITDLSSAVLLIWFTILLVLVSFSDCFHLLCVLSSPEPKAHGELILYQSIRRLCIS